MYDAPTLETLFGYSIGVALPALSLAFGTMVVLLVGIFLPQERRRWIPVLALSGISASFVMTLFNLSPERTEAFSGMFVGDAFTGVLNIIILVAAFITVLLSADYLERNHINHSEYYTLILLSASGAMFMAGANDLLMVFIALELLSIPLYALAAFRATNMIDRNDASIKSEEAGVKYFVLGAFASAFFVYGAALIYGATGTTNLEAIFAAVPQILADEAATGRVLLLLGAALAFVGLGFKVAVVPFHMWTPDVYEGAPTPVTAFMSVVAKVGGFASLLRLMVVGLSSFAIGEAQAASWQNTLQLVAALTLLLGNIVALSQTNIKRMLAYSSIAHAGYILMAVAAVGSAPLIEGIGNVATQAVLVYMAAYALTNFGAFAVVMAIEKADGTGTDTADFKGLANSRPFLALAMAVFMFSLTGIPLTAGFMGKWLVFGAVVQAGLIPLAVVGVLTSVVSAFYYMRIVVNMYLETDAAGDEAQGATRPLRWAIYASLLGVVALGVLPTLITGLVGLVQLV